MNEGVFLCILVNEMNPKTSLLFSLLLKTFNSTQIYRVGCMRRWALRYASIAAALLLLASIRKSPSFEIEFHSEVRLDQVQYSLQKPLPDNFKSRLVLISGLSGMSQVNSILSAVQVEIGDKLIIHDDIENLFEDRLIRELVKAVKSLDYDVASIKEQEFHLKTVRCFQKLISLCKQWTLVDGVHAIFVPNLVFFLPFVKHMFSTASIAVDVLVAFQDGISYSFDPDSELLTEILGPMLADENVIDNICLSRVRPYTNTYKVTNSSWNELNTILSREFPASVSTHTLEAPCSIDEIPKLRATLVWNAVHLQFVDPEFQRKMSINLMHTSDTVSIKNGSLHIEHDTKVSAPSIKNVILDRHLFTDLESIQSSLIVSNLGLVLPKCIMCISRTVPRIDSGFCTPKVNLNKFPVGLRRNIVVTAGYCLPSMLIIGTQKAGTDELAVWLKKNFYIGRLAGGVENHYFDCFGRSTGKTRESCHRLRDYRIHQDQAAVKKSLKDIKNVENHKYYFSWSDINKEHSNYVSSTWDHYLRLGKLSYGPYIRHNLVFEKTPSYLDMAHPPDMAQLLPSVKLVILLRDPAKRLVSSYFQLCHGSLSIFKDRCTFEDLETRIDSLSQWREQGSSLFEDMFFRAVEMGFYAKWLSKWRRTFPDQQLLVLFSEHFSSQPQTVLRELESFSGLNSSQHHNFHPIYQHGVYVLGGYSKVNNPTHKVDTPHSLLDKINSHYKYANQNFYNLLMNSEIEFGRNNSNLTLPSWASGTP